MTGIDPTEYVTPPEYRIERLGAQLRLVAVFDEGDKERAIQFTVSDS